MLLIKKFSFAMFRVYFRVCEVEGAGLVLKEKKENRFVQLDFGMKFVNLHAKFAPCHFFQGRRGRRGKKGPKGEKGNEVC